MSIKAESTREYTARVSCDAAGCGAQLIGARKLPRKEIKPEAKRLHAESTWQTVQMFLGHYDADDKAIIETLHFCARCLR